MSRVIAHARSLCHIARVAVGRIGFKAEGVRPTYLTKTSTCAALRDGETLLAAEMSCADVKGLFKEYLAAGVPMIRGLKNEPWGARNFIIRDPDGNLLLFAGD